MPTTPLTHLTSTHQLLTLINHRNKNQHRLAKWWKEFSQLRRHIGKLIAEVETRDSYEALSAKAKKTDEARERVEQRVVFMETYLVERCYLAFSNVVSDNQYAPLGLVLMGTLARTKTVLQSLRKGGVEQENDEDEKFVEEQVEQPVVATNNVDLGEVVARDVPTKQPKREEDARDEFSVTKPGESNDMEQRGQEPVVGQGTKRETIKVQSPIEKSLEGKPNSVKRPKKRKKRDAFDELFDGLI